MMLNRYLIAILWPLATLGIGVSQCAAQRGAADPEDRLPGAERPAPLERHLIVITDDDFLFPEQTAWCASALTRAISLFERGRPGDTVTLQGRFAGAPAILRGGRSANGPQRAIGFLCDADERILAFWVGVPTSEQLMALAEDADEVSVLALAGRWADESAADQQPDRVLEVLHGRARSRVLRHYQPLLQKIHRQMPVTEAARALQPALAADLAERFLITAVTDQLRLASAQQHPETMRHWCEAMLPSVVGRRVDDVWQELATILWGRRPWTIAPEDADVLTWYAESISEGPLVLSIRSADPLLAQPERRAEARRGRAAARTSDRVERLEQSLDLVTHRDVGLPALARLMQHRQDKPVDWLGSAEPHGGWAVFAAPEQPPQLIAASASHRVVDAVRKLLVRP